MQRMRILSKLAYDPNGQWFARMRVDPSRGERQIVSDDSLVVLSVKDDGTTRASHKKPKEDTFGQNDEDWMVYRAIVSFPCSPFKQ